MPGKDSQKTKSDARVSELLRLANSATAGRFEDLECPTCRRNAVSVWFTHPAADVYRMWFVCADCDFHSRAQLADRPSYFLESRVHPELEERDRAILKQSIFKGPSQ